MTLSCKWPFNTKNERNNASSLPNRPVPSSKKSHFQNEAKCETFVVKMSFICMIIKNHFHINGFAFSLALKVRLFGTRKWPIGFLIFSYPWFSHTYPHSNRICPSTRIRQISGLFLLPRTPLGILETEHASM